LKRRETLRLFTAIVILTLSLTAKGILPTIPGAHATGNPILNPVSITPASIVDLQQNMKTVTFNVTVSNSPPITGFSVYLQFNEAVMTTSLSQISLTGNVLGPSSKTTLLEECLDFRGTGCGQFDPGPLPGMGGEIGVTLIYNGNFTTPNPTSGLLFSIQFNVVGVGFSQVHIFHAELTSGQGSSITNIPINTIDGYYTNIACPRTSTSACLPPQVSITITPTTPSQDGIASFNATVIDPNANSGVLRYLWNWGDKNAPQNQTDLAVPITHVYQLNGNVSITMTVYDNQSIVWSTLTMVNVLSVRFHLNLAGVNVAPQRLYYYPGTIFHLTASLVNLSPVSEDANLTITVEGKLLNNTLLTLGPGETGTETAVWNTTGLVARYYSILASLILSSIITTNPIPTPNGLARVPYENETTSTGYLPTPCLQSAHCTGSVEATYILLTVPQITGALSLSLFETAGLGVLVLIGAGLGIGRLFRKPGFEKEPLEVGE
jgi:PKD domain